MAARCARYAMAMVATPNTPQATFARNAAQNTRSGNLKPQVKVSRLKAQAVEPLNEFLPLFYINQIKLNNHTIPNLGDLRIT